MQKIEFTKKSGANVSDFTSWLEQFEGDVSDNSVLLEINPAAKCFCAKVFTQDQALVRRGEISFENAGLEVVIPDGLTDIVYAGILKIFSKFVAVFKAFATADEFTMTFNFGPGQDSQGNEMLQTDNVRFRSKSLRMKMKCFLISEFIVISDDKFKNGVWPNPDPVSVTVSSEVIKNILAFSEIFKQTQSTENLLFFYSKTEDGKRVMYVKDKKNTFDYLVGDIKTDLTDWQDIIVPVMRDKFILCFKTTGMNSAVLTMSVTDPMKLCVETIGTGTQSVIAKVDNIAPDQDDYEI